MKKDAITAWPSTQPVLPELMISTYTPSSRRNKPGVVKLLPPPPTPPDEETIRRLNALAATNPFCTLHQVKKHELL